jgi:hypothetical protein
VTRRLGGRLGISNTDVATALGLICPLWAGGVDHDVDQRMRAKLKAVNEQLKRRRHTPIPDQGRWLASVLRGHIAYYAVPGNTDRVATFRTQMTRHWFKALRRRSLDDLPVLVGQQRREVSGPFTCGGTLTAVLALPPGIATSGTW